MNREATNHKNLDRPTALKLIASGKVDKMGPAFISLAYHDHDPEWVIDKLADTLTGSDPEVQAMVLHCLFLLSRVRQTLRASQAYSIALKHLSSSHQETYEAADELLDEVVNVVAGKSSRTLAEIGKALNLPNDLDQLVVVNQLFCYEEPRDEIKKYAREILTNAAPLVRARCLYEVRSILLQSDDTIDSEFVEEILELADKDTSAYTVKKTQELRDWVSDFEQF